MSMPLLEAGLNLLAAAGLGAAIGLERQWRQRLAGLRTNTLVALGAAIFVLYSRIGHDEPGAARMAAQVVTGIGFLGAGVIFKEGVNIRGLNTAATLWCSAAVGLLAGGGLALYGALGAAFVIGANVALRPLVRAINRQPVDFSEMEISYVISIVCRGQVAPQVRSLLVQALNDLPEVLFSELSSAHVEETDRVELSATVTSHKRRDIALEAIIGRISKEEGVTRAGWRSQTQSV
jgi:putative Mg2+ transporter-C (MgtC) family protein